MSNFTIVLRACPDEMVAANVAALVPQARVKRIFPVHANGQVLVLLEAKDEDRGLVRAQLSNWMWIADSVAHTIGDSLKPGDLVWWTVR